MSAGESLSRNQCCDLVVSVVVGMIMVKIACSGRDGSGGRSGDGKSASVG